MIEEEKQLVADIMVSAGPRKEHDGGLGEDACGLLLRHNCCFFWVSDGTSDCPVLENKNHSINFSSRILAHALGENFRNQILDFAKFKLKLFNKENVVKELLRYSLDGVMQEWNDQLCFIQSEAKTYLDALFDAHTDEFIDFSSTFLCGVMTTSGHLQLGCFGDSPVVFKRNNVYEIVRPKNYRFFMRLRKNDDGYFFSTSNEFNIESYCWDDVSLVVAGSDGIGRLPEMIKDLGDKISFAKIRRRFSLYDPNSKDDKALCIVSLENS